jgi:hypothetical protein
VEFGNGAGAHANVRELPAANTTVVPCVAAGQRFCCTIRTDTIMWILAAWMTLLPPTMPARSTLNCNGAGTSQGATQIVAGTRKSANEQPGAEPRVISGSASNTSMPGGEVATPPPVISSQAQKVSEIANQRGDRTYLMVDKAQGEIILFEDGRPIYRSAALTGKSLGDYLPPRAINVPTSRHPSADLKVTPAGRYTVSRERDAEFGTVFTINEIKGKDWDIGVHRVFLGDPAEHRAERLRSANRDDRHISFGCINVDPDTIRVLTRHLAKLRKTPIYILPQDVSRTMAIFGPG